MMTTYETIQANRAYEAWLIERAVIVVGACLLVLAVVLIWRYRRRIARAADEAAVTTLAAVVKAKRKISDKADAYRQRIIDRAGEPDPPAR